MSKSKSLTKRPSKPKTAIAEILKRFGKAMPDARCELYYETPFQLLVSVVLSAQTTDKMVNRCMEPLYERGFDLDTVEELGEQGLLANIRSIGLAPTKAKNIVKLTGILKREHHGRVPNDREALEALPGVGRKTANVILGEIFHAPTLAVDTHVFRVSHRLGLSTAKNPLAVEQDLLKLIAPKFLPRAHHWFILHGRYTCKAAKPLCAACIVQDLCPAFKGFQSAAAPATSGSKPAARKRLKSG